MSEEKSSYQQIIKATSIFGGVQFFQIVIGLIRSKLVAVLLGPAGMGINGLLTSTTGLIEAFTNLGLSTSAVRNIAEAGLSDDSRKINIVVGVLNRMVWVTGFIGSLFCLIFSSWLSQITFGNRDFAFSFVLISATILFNQLALALGAVLRGLRYLKYMAQSSVIGSLLGLVVSIPLYYSFGKEGIAPAIILTSITTLTLAIFYYRKAGIRAEKSTIKATLAEGKGMIILGVLLSLSSLIALAASYILRIFISKSGGVGDVGLYNAGFAIINTYVGMVFTAMGTDYYPRLSAIASDNHKASILINQQGEVALLILAPILIVFLVFIKFVIVLLYSGDFLPISGMIKWAALGMFFKAVSWAVAFIFLAKGANRLFFWNELITNAYLLVLNILGYKYWGLAGLGGSFMIGYFIYFIQVYIIARKFYDYRISNEFLKLLGLQFAIAVLGFLSSEYLTGLTSYFFGVVLIGLSSLLSIYYLNKMLPLAAMIASLKARLKK